MSAGADKPEPAAAAGGAPPAPRRTQSGCGRGAAAGHTRADVTSAAESAAPPVRLPPSHGWCWTFQSKLASDSSLYRHKISKDAIPEARNCIQELEADWDRKWSETLKDSPLAAFLQEDLVSVTAAMRTFTAFVTVVTQARLSGRGAPVADGAAVL